jgi:hypothetical protein
MVKFMPKYHTIVSSAASRLKAGSTKLTWDYVAPRLLVITLIFLLIPLMIWFLSWYASAH